MLLVFLISLIRLLSLGPIDINDYENDPYKDTRESVFLMFGMSFSTLVICCPLLLCAKCCCCRTKRPKTEYEVYNMSLDNRGHATFTRNHAD